MCYKSIVNELDKFLIKNNRKNSCTGCPISDLIEPSDYDFGDKLEEEFNIESACITRLFYNIKKILPEDKINFLLEKLKENNIHHVNCGFYEEGSSHFIKVLRSIISNDLEIE